MNTTDLMIGDWVKILNNKGEWIDNGKVDLNLLFAAEHYVTILEPIPITLEILEKNGFAKDNKNENMYYWNWRIIEDCVSYDKETTIFRIFHTLGNLVFVHPLSYIHELQHALKLCNVKLNIEL